MSMQTTIRKSTGDDPRETPAYTLAEAARYLRLPSATLRDWFVGRQYADGRKPFAPLVKPASRKPPLLSFSNLIEGHVLRSLRTEHGVSVKALRDAIRYAQKQLKMDRLLLCEDLRTVAGEVFLEKYGELIDLSASGQLAMRKVFEDHLKRVEWDDGRFPIRLYPFLTASAPGAERHIVIDARLAFGRPVVASQSVSTAAIADRIDAGESVDELAADYELDRSEVEEAVVYERAA